MNISTLNIEFKHFFFLIGILSNIGGGFFFLEGIFFALQWVQGYYAPFISSMDLAAEQCLTGKLTWPIFVICHFFFETLAIDYLERTEL